jgi:hypothetical protein
VEGRSGPRFYASAEYLLWDIKDSNFPVLVTTGPPPTPQPPGTPGPGPAVAGLGNPSTAILFGGDSVENGLRSGGRFTAGYWFDCCETCGIEASGFFLGQRSIFFNSALPVLARPFFNIATGQESSEVTALPGTATGSIAIEAPSRLWGAEVDLRHNLCCGCWYRVDGLLGFRYLDLKEGLHIFEDIHVITNSPPFAAGTELQVSDRFDTRNQFYGAQVGLDTELRRGRWSLDLKTKVAIGDVEETVNIAGNFLVLPPPGAGRPQVFNGGLLALTSNSGHFVRDRFAVVPEVGATLGYDLTPHVKLFAGYNFLFWSNVVRPGDQIDRNLNPRLIPEFCKSGPAQCPPNNIAVQRPAFEFHETTFWAQGLTAGVEFKY